MEIMEISEFPNFHQNFQQEERQKMAQKLAGRIERGRRAIAMARGQGLDTQEWEEHLNRLIEAEQQQRKLPELPTGGEALPEEDPIKDLQEMVLALTRERLANPPRKERKSQAPSRKSWETKNPTLTFRTNLAVRAQLDYRKEKDNLTFLDIMMVGLERLEQLELVNVLKTKISNKQEEL